MTRPACHVHIRGTNRGPHEDGEIARPKQIRYSRNGLASYTLEFFLPTWEYSATVGKPCKIGLVTCLQYENARGKS